MVEIESTVKDWKPESSGYQTAEGFTIPYAMRKNVLQCYSMPGSIIGIDNKYGTDVFKTVLESAAPKVKFMVDEDKNEVLSVLDPRSKFLPDDKFDKLSDRFAQALGDVSLKVKESGLSKTITYSLADVYTDSVFGDVYKRQVKLTRLPEGGVQYSGALLRLACTNGMVVPDSQFSKLYRSADIPKAAILSLSGDVLALDLQEYLKSLFYKDSETPIEASVADFIGMKRTLAKFTDNDVADTFYPQTVIEDFYNRFGIDAFGSSSSVQATLRSGMTYYDCFNILTNGIKQAPELSLKEQIEVARWIKPSKLTTLKVTNNYTGHPQFDSTLIKSLKGDVQAA